MKYEVVLSNDKFMELIGNDFIHNDGDPSRYQSMYNYIHLDMYPFKLIFDDECKYTSFIIKYM